MKIETKCLHEGYTPKNGEPRVMPIVQSTTYVYDSTDDVAAVFDDPLRTRQRTALRRKLRRSRAELLQCARRAVRRLLFCRF